ncbi:hypothetical protein ACFL2T_06470 [Elusimicrobiota bacterium]
MESESKMSGIEALVAKAAADPDLRVKVIADPVGASKEAGVSLSDTEREILRAVARRTLTNMVETFEKTGIFVFASAEQPPDDVMAVSLGIEPDEPSPPEDRADVAERLIVAMVVMSVNKDASMVRIESTEDVVAVRFKVGEEFQPGPPLPARMVPGLRSKLMEMSGLDIEKKEGAQEGVFAMEGGDIKYEVTVSLPEGVAGKVIELLVKKAG